MEDNRINYLVRCMGTGPPGNPIIDAGSETAGVVAGLAPLFISTILNLLAPFFFEKKQTRNL